MTEQELQKIEARCNAATPGRWYREPRWGRVWVNTLAHSPIAGKCFEYKLVADAHGGDNAVFIAAAKQDIPALIAALREAWGELGRADKYIYEKYGPEAFANYSMARRPQ